MAINALPGAPGDARVWKVGVSSPSHWRNRSHVEHGKPVHVAFVWHNMPESWYGPVLGSHYVAAKLYINGILETQILVRSEIQLHQFRLILGSWDGLVDAIKNPIVNTGTSVSLNCSKVTALEIDEFRWWRRPLATDEITQGMTKRPKYVLRVSSLFLFHFFLSQLLIFIAGVVRAIQICWSPGLSTMQSRRM